MKKIPTLFLKDPNNLGRVTNEVDPQNEWVSDYGIPTRKYDGTACAIIKGILYKRYDAKGGKPVKNGIPCQDPDPITGHWPHWVLCERENPSDKYHFEAFDAPMASYADGTYELLGPKINGNKEKFRSYRLVRHGFFVCAIHDFGFDSINKFLSENDFEGIVFHHANDKSLMCKIRKSDFGIKR